MRLALLVLCVLLSSCGPGLTLQEPGGKFAGDVATHIFTGVIQYQQLDSWPFFRVPGDDTGYWRIFRRRVRVELVVRGGPMADVVDLFEIAWIGGASGDWNATQVGERAVFLAKMESGKLRTVWDHQRCIHRIYSGRHDRLPGNERMPAWERLGLLSLWPKPGWHPAMATRDLTYYERWSHWRTIKIHRGFLRHPDIRLRLAACESLLSTGRAIDECWEQFDFVEKSQLDTYFNAIPPEEKWRDSRRFLPLAEKYWKWDLDALRKAQPTRAIALDQLRLYTTINDHALRERFCKEFRTLAPGDTDHGCDADRPLPASIVTEAGDVPLDPR